MGTSLNNLFSYLRTWDYENCVRSVRPTFQFVDLLILSKSVALKNEIAEFEILKFEVSNFRNFEKLKSRGRAPEIDEYPHEKSLKSWICISYLSKSMKWTFGIFLFSNEGIPSTPQHIDSHSCTRPGWSHSLSWWRFGFSRQGRPQITPKSSRVLAWSSHPDNSGPFIPPW